MFWLVAGPLLTHSRVNELNGKIFCNLKEAKVDIEQRRKRYNTIHPALRTWISPPAP